MVDNDNEKHLSIKSVLNSKQIEIEDDDEFKALLEESEIADEIFVWGQTVDDFHSIDKNYIFTVATAALQEVDRQLQTTKEDLQTTKTELKADLQTTRTELAEERALHETTRTQLRNTQTELDVAKIKLLNIEARMQIIESNISKVVV
jgi:septal ring factor EnvC (AmiA/AmiB activator)